MKVLWISILLLSASLLRAQLLLDATISFNGSNQLVMTINSAASFQFNQSHDGAVSLVIDEAYSADPNMGFTTSLSGGSGITFTSSNGNTGSANQIGAFGINYGIYTIRDEEITFPEPGPSFSSGDILTIQPGTVIGLATVSNPPPINPGPYTAYIASDDYFSIAAIQVTPAPVKLIDFKAKQKDENIQLHWSTSNEINNEKFEIEKSSNGKDFRKIGEVKGNGTSSIQQVYSFDVKNPQNGISYFRLKQIDFDGHSSFSNVINLDFRGKNESVEKLYPNPSKNGLVNLKYFAKSYDFVNVRVLDVSGKMVINKNQAITKGNNNLRFDFSELNPGIYVFRIGNDINSIQQKLIID